MSRLEILDTGANALVLPKREGMTGTEAQCTYGTWWQCGLWHGGASGGL